MGGWVGVLVGGRGGTKTKNRILVDVAEKYILKVRIPIEDGQRV